MSGVFGCVCAFLVTIASLRCPVAGDFNGCRLCLRNQICIFFSCQECCSSRIGVWILLLRPSEEESGVFRFDGDPRHKRFCIQVKRSPSLVGSALSLICAPGLATPLRPCFLSKRKSRSNRRERLMAGKLGKYVDPFV